MITQRNVLPSSATPAHAYGLSVYFTRMSLTATLTLQLCLSLSACDDADSARPQDDSMRSPDATSLNLDMGRPLDSEIEEMLDSDTAEPVSCVSSRRPLVLIHGFLAAGDTWSRQTQRLIATGSCPDHIAVYDWNTLDMSIDHSEALAALIDELRAESGADQVDLIGHSAGGGVAYSFLERADYAREVHAYVHIGSFANDAPPTPEGGAPLSTLNLWSRGDLAVEGADIPGALNVSLETEDHYAVATSFRSYTEITAFLYQEAALAEDPRPAARERGEVTLRGRALTLGTNQALVDTSVNVWTLDERGRRETQASALTTDPEGRFSVTLDARVRYELAVEESDAESPKVRYFTPPLERDDALFYLRTFPGPGSLASILVSQLPQRDDVISLVFFNAHRAFIAGRDSLKLNGRELITPEVASAENTTIALFAFDVNADGEPGGSVALFDSFPFLAAVDLPLTPDPEASLEVSYQGETFMLPATASSEGTLIVVFP